MTLMNKTLSVLVVAGLVLAGCGKNPFGPGAAGGLNLFAKIGKAVSKPSAVNEKENGKEGAQSTITAGAAKQYLGKSLQAQAIWIVDNGVTENTDGSCTYWEQVRDKPDDRDPMKKFTGRGEINFKYAGPKPVDLTNIVLSQIQDIYSFRANGREVRTWSGVIDTIEILVTFSQGTLQDCNSITPGYTTARGKNISATEAQGKGDSAMFTLTRLDDATHIQYGAGTFFDAKDDNGESHLFSFDVEIIHKNNHPELVGGCTNPYLRYEDNEGVVTFTLPWGKTGDNLYFNIHFYPPEGDTLGYRVINIYKNNASGEKLYYLKADDHGVELESEDYTD